ncbi:cupin [Kiloniella litopenaei]|uniref:Cupin n=1 Tax=Kiloniella litopenaei TaxID=1549748 RepID=A0A0M2REF3_9PROT|nr:cupin domain-containing protein [Kiloniella litopenaei]KKJ77948.1 cupin [Kiloniella litopenaei]
MSDRNVVNLPGALDQVTAHWSPKVLARVNDQFVKIAKIKNELVWHKHDNEDELFYIIKGQLLMQYEDKTIELNEGDMHVVPKGVMHNPVAKEECWIMLVEPVTTAHTGDVITDRTRSLEDQMQT